MQLEIYAIYNETKKRWWCHGYMKPEPCNPYLWYNKKKAEKHLKGVDEIYGFTEDGDDVRVVTLELNT